MPTIVQIRRFIKKLGVVACSCLLHYVSIFW